MPPSRITSASTVGLPRESRTSRPLMSTIFAIAYNTPNVYERGCLPVTANGRALYRRIARSGSLNRRETLDQVVQLLELGEEGLQLVQAQGTGAVALGVVRVRMGLEEQAGQALAHAGLGQVGDLGAAAAGRIGTATRHLQGMGHVEEHRVLEGLHDAEAEHVHHQVVVTEGRATLAEDQLVV